MVEDHTTDGGLHCWRSYLRYQPRGTEGPCSPVARRSLVSEKQEDSQQRPEVRICVCVGVVGVLRLVGQRQAGEGGEHYRRVRTCSS